MVVGPEFAARLKPSWLLWLVDQSWSGLAGRYLIVGAIVGTQLTAYHLYLAAGKRRLAEVWPGVLLSMVLWVVAARLFAYWLTINDYSRFYAGLTQLMSALVFFQVTAMIIILGAEVNRATTEMRRKLALAEAINHPSQPPGRAHYGLDH